MNTKPHSNLRTSALPGHATHISVVQLADMIKAGEPLLILDVREKSEVAQSSPKIEGIKHIPMQEVVAHWENLPTDRPIAVLCRSGGRSAIVSRLLRSHGLDAINIDGGLVAWKTYIDPTLPTP